MRAVSLAAIGLASVAAAGCFLQQDSGGYPGTSSTSSTSSRAGSDGSDGGAGGSGEGAAGGGAAMNCSALPFGCVCAPAEPSQVGACTTSSVIKGPSQRGACCDNGFNCICVAYECVRMGGGCACQLAQASLAGARVDDCAAVTVNPAIKCCRSYGQCVCGTVDCLLTETQVAGCSVQDLLTCAAGEATVASCEPAGAGASAGTDAGAASMRE
jgi:hypothetical protein